MPKEHHLVKIRLMDTVNFNSCVIAVQPRSQGLLPFLYQEDGPPDVKVRRPGNEVDCC